MAGQCAGMSADGRQVLATLDKGTHLGADFDGQTFAFINRDMFKELLVTGDESADTVTYRVVTFARGLRLMSMQPTKVRGFTEGEAARTEWGTAASGRA